MKKMLMMFVVTASLISARAAVVGKDVEYKAGENNVFSGTNIY